MLDLAVLVADDNLIVVKIRWIVEVDLLVAGAENMVEAGWAAMTGGLIVGEIVFVDEETLVNFAINA